MGGDGPTGGDESPPLGPAGPIDGAATGTGDPRAGGTGSADPGDGPWAGDSGILAALGQSGNLLATLPTTAVAVTTTSAVVVWMGFITFGRRRRDGQPPEPDAVLAASAGRADHVVVSSALVSGPTAVPLSSDPEFGIPRWRRASLLEARRADPLRAPVVVAPRQTFRRDSMAPDHDRERRLIRYRVVRLLDAPDEFRASEIGVLDQGDEVEVVDQSGVYRLVRCPDGGQGWIHKMTLGDVVDDDPSPTPAQAWGTRAANASDQSGDGSLLGQFIAGRSGA